MKKLFVISLFSSVFTTGCAMASFKAERPNGGKIQYSGPGDTGVKKAQALMTLKCPQGYDETERGSEGSGGRLGTGYGGSVDIPIQYIEFKCKEGSPERNTASKTN